MHQLFNDSEKYTYHICKQTFLTLWSYANPLGKNGRELCDILIVCDPHVIIISVKKVTFKETGDLDIDWNRWHREAVEKSVDQIYGAERWIRNAPNVIRSDGSQGVAFPGGDRIRIHRVAISFGGNRKVPIRFGDFDKGFAHVFDEESFDVILSELNTITDFINYLTEKERLLGNVGTRLVCEGEENLLAFYIHNGREFETNCTDLLVTSDCWSELRRREEYKRKQREDEVSYRWDWLIETIGNDILNKDLEFGNEIEDSEEGLRVMAKESRFDRRILSSQFLEFFELARHKKIRSRIVVSQSGIVYVFLATPHDTDREQRTGELQLRCFVARGQHPDSNCIVGIATEQYEQGKGFSFDLVYLFKEDWSEADRERMSEVQKQCGLFVNPTMTKRTYDEYPDSASN